MKKDSPKKVFTSAEEYDNYISYKRKSRVKSLILIIFLFLTFALFTLNEFLGGAFFFIGAILMGDVLRYFTGDDA